MIRSMLKSKIHGATVTEASLYYEGSITIDTELMKLADIHPYERVTVSNLNNGERFETYAIPGKPGEVCLNGPTARKGLPGDTVIVFTYCYLPDAEAAGFEPHIIKVDKSNRPV